MKKFLSVLILCFIISFGQVNASALQNKNYDLSVVSTAINNIFMKIQPKRKTAFFNSYLLIYKGNLNPLCRAAQPDIKIPSEESSIADKGTEQPIAPGHIPSETQMPLQTPAQKPGPTIRQTDPPNTIPPHTNPGSIKNPESTKPTRTPTETKTQASVPPGEYSVYQRKVVELVNQERSAAGVGPLTENEKLDDIATLKSQDMVNLNYFSHQSPTYGSPFDMLKKYDFLYSFAGENIAYGQSSPEEVMNSWMNSPGHRANILNTNYTQIGVGIAKKANGQLVWTQTFVKP